MLRFRATLLLATLLTPIAVHAEADPALWRFVYPNAKALISVDWTRIRDSQAGAMFRDKFSTVKGVQLPPVPGMELLNDIDRILISSPGNQSPGDTGEPPFLIAIHGHFDAAKVRHVFTEFGTRPQAYNSFQVYRPQRKQNKDTALVLFDNETILFGDAPSVFATLDRNQYGAPAVQPAPAPDSMSARAAAMEGAYDFWLIMDATEVLSSDSVAPLLKGNDWSSDARAFEAGISLRAGLTADVTVRFATEGSAKRMIDEITRALHQEMNKMPNAQAREIANKLKFNVDGAATKISLHMTEQEMEKAAQAMAAAQRAGFEMARKAQATASSRPESIAVPRPEKPAVIRIQGLDDGERDIPYPTPQH